MSESFSYFIELRRRLMRYLIILGVLFGSLAIVAKEIYRLLALPLLQHFAVGANGLIATSVTAPFLVPFKSALVVAIFLSIPVLLYELWAFIAPALYRQERKIVWLLLLSSSLLFYVGTLFAYFVVLPIVFKFFLYIAPVGVEVKPDVNQYFSFIVKLFFAFGFSFELPVAMLLLQWTGVCSVDQLRKARPYIIVGAFIVGMLLTPPDIISQLLLAIPLWILYELGLVLGKLEFKFFDKRDRLL